MIMGVGVDIVKIERFAKKPLSQNLKNRLFTPHEQAYLKNRKANSMAGLFAAKEAIAKAIGTGFKGFWPNDIEIQHDENGKPHVKLHGNAKKATPSGSFSVSISHNETDAVAFAILSTTN